MDSGWRLALCLVVGMTVLVVSPSPDKMMIVGGRRGGVVNIVEECVVV